MNNKLLELQNIIEDTLFGGQVKKFGKDNLLPVIDPYEFQIVQDYLEEGISLMTSLDTLHQVMALVKILINQIIGITLGNTLSYRYGLLFWRCS